mmetsp:Transcript_8043/g.24232  ORF Transcript_8043/g.24232 Transcript_8043/m.24232 type:complete len:127 (+) Transcript_8043:111-491(+)
MWVRVAWAARVRCLGLECRHLQLLRRLTSNISAQNGPDGIKTLCTEKDMAERRPTTKKEGGLLWLARGKPGAHRSGVCKEGEAGGRHGGDHEFECALGGPQQWPRSLPARKDLLLCCCTSGRERKV